MSVQVGQTLKNITALGGTQDDLSEAILTEITDEIKKEYGRVYETADHQALNRVCSSRGYGPWNPEKKGCLMLHTFLVQTHIENCESNIIYSRSI